MIRILIKIIFLVNASFSLYLSYAQAEPSDLDFNQLAKEIISNSDQHAQWLALGHWYKSNLGKTKSYIDSKSFFLADKGKTNPKDELKETLKLFLAPQNKLLKETKNHELRCQFQARSLFIKKALSNKYPNLFRIIDNNSNCENFLEWKNDLRATSATLVFPTAYMNNPASMFGHTFIRLNNSISPLSSYSINFGAETGNDGGFAFAIKGLLGGYKGYFSLLPYYQQVNKYSDLESRDVWEYDLGLTKAEFELLIAHIWELRNEYIDYFFFDENCSFHLLGLLDVARPSLRLSREFKFWALPPDTVRAVANKRNLIKATSYRPSLSTQIKKKVSILDPHALKKVKQISNNCKSENVLNFKHQQKSEILDLAFDFFRYKTIKNKLSYQCSDNPNKFAHKILLELNKNKSPKEVSIKTPISPNNGHKTRLIEVGLGKENSNIKRDKFSEFSFRPVFHELLDKDEGYLPTSEISFFTFKLRSDLDSHLKLDSFYPLKITSLNPRDELFKSLSWGVNLGVERKEFKKDSLTPSLDASFGISGKFNKKSLAFIMIKTAFEQNSKFNENFQIFSGPNLGTIINVSDNTKAFLRGESLISDGLRQNKAEFDIAYFLNKNLSLRININRKNEFSNYRNSFGTYIRHYY